MRESALDDKAARQSLIAGSIWYTVPGTILCIAGAYAWLAPIAGLDDTSARLGLAARWLLVAMIPYAAVCLTILSRRFIEGAHNPLAGMEGERLRIHCRVMQNTLEQLVWLAFCIAALAVLLAPEQARLIPVACAFFVVARFVYWWGYLRKGTLGRAPGVQLTFTLNIFLFGLALALLGKDLFG